MNKRILNILFACLMASLALVLSCDIGLGHAVDTEAPSLTIEYPPASAVVMDNFKLSGT